MENKSKNIVGFLLILVVCVFGYRFFSSDSPTTTPTPIDSAPQSTTRTGTYVCLPHRDTISPQTEECRFGIKTQGGQYYAVNLARLPML